MPKIIEERKKNNHYRKTVTVTVKVTDNVRNFESAAGMIYLIL